FEDRQGARLDDSADAARPRRRGDRITSSLLRLLSKRTWRHAATMSALRAKPDDICSLRAFERSSGTFRRLCLPSSVTDWAIKAWYHPSIARMTPTRRVPWQATSDDENF